MTKRAEMRRRRHARRDRQRTTLYVIGGVILIAVVIGIIVAVVNANNQGGTKSAEGFTTTASGLQYKITEEGSGPKPQPGDQVLVEYRGTLEDGTEFDSGQIPFQLGTGAVIDGWDEGIALLNEGGSAEFIIPPDLAYGPVANGPIPANSTLFFEVTLLEITSGQ